MSVFLRFDEYGKIEEQVIALHMENYADENPGVMELAAPLAHLNYHLVGGELVELPPKPNPYCMWQGEWVDPRPLEELQESARAAINRWRDAQEAIGTVFEHAGRMWDCNPAAKDKLQSTAAMPAVPPGFFWTDASEPVNQDVPMDIDGVRALNEAHKIAYFTRGLQIHVRQREMKAALDAMDAAQLAAFVPGWLPESN